MEGLGLMRRAEADPTQPLCPGKWVQHRSLSVMEASYLKPPSISLPVTNNKGTSILQLLDSVYTGVLSCDDQYWLST